MKHFQKIGYSLVILLSLLACESDTSSPKQESCGSPADRVMKVSFTLDGKHYDLDSAEAFFGANNFVIDDDTSYVNYERETSDMYYQLKISWPGNDSSGTFPWQSSSSYLKGYGCFITTDSLLEKRRYSYMPASGSTTIAMYGDTLFGIFCGQLKDSLGGMHEVSNGRFYYLSN
jgi:hypothetical protein